MPENAALHIFGVLPHPEDFTTRSSNLLSPLCFLFRTITRKDPEQEGKGQKDRPIIHKLSRSHSTTIYRKPISVHNTHFITSSLTLEADDAIEKALDPPPHSPACTPLLLFLVFLLLLLLHTTRGLMDRSLWLKQLVLRFHHLNGWQK